MTHKICNHCETVQHCSQHGCIPSVPADPMDWPLPCEVTVGHGTIGKGAPLRTLVSRMKVLYRMATGNDADEVQNRTPEQRQALTDAFIASVQPAATPQAQKPGAAEVTDAMRIAGIESAAWDRLSSAAVRKGGWPYTCKQAAECVAEVYAAMQAAAAPSATAAPGVQLARARAGRIYVAGPMTGLPEFNFPAFNSAAAELRGQGMLVVNPAEHGIIDGAEWADYLHYDLGRLATCSTIHLLPGWSKSRGAALEALCAYTLGMRFDYAQGAEKVQLVDALQAISAPAAVSPQNLTRAVRDVLAERQRQIEVEGWTPEHDDKHGGGQIAAAAGCYALFTDTHPIAGYCPRNWPWDASWWKPTHYRHDLVKSGALVLAELERIDRAALAAQQAEKHQAGGA